jgi:hypothetical protein
VKQLVTYYEIPGRSAARNKATLAPLIITAHEKKENRTAPQLLHKPYKYCAIIFDHCIFLFPTYTYFEAGPRRVAGRHCDASAPISKRMASRVADWPYCDKVK